MDASYYKEKYEPINGKWYIKELLGEGSYGKVLRIEYKDVLGKTTEAALKVITIPQSEKEIDSVREALQDDNSVNQYFTNMASKIADEFNVLAQLKGNTNIVSYEEHDIFPHENGIGYDILIRMELLKPLNKLIDAISEQEVIKLGIDICRALEVCQKHNIVHRDIKPENIFVSSMGDYKLGDFGVAKTMKHEMTVMTVTGTYVYMAPELKKGEECGTNVDIYSLGMVMYKLLNFNREPFLPLPPEMFTFEQREQALINRMKGIPLPKPANASEPLSDIILKACEYNPKIRYENPAQMRRELESLLAKYKAENTVDISISLNNLTNAEADIVEPKEVIADRSDDVPGFCPGETETNQNCVNNFEESQKHKEFDETVGIFEIHPKVDTENKFYDLKCSQMDVHTFVKNQVSETLLNTDNLYIAEHSKFTRKLSSAVASYAKYCCDEKPLVLYDYTIFGSAREGFLITDKKIYIYQKFLQPKVIIPLDAIESIQSYSDYVTISFDGKTAVIKFICEIKTASDVSSGYVKLIQNVVDFLRDNHCGIFSD